MKDKKFVNEPAQVKPAFYLSGAFQTMLFGMVLLSLILSTIALTQNQAAKPALSDAQRIIVKLNAHAEMQAMRSIVPSGLVQITQENLATLQAQVQGLDSSFLESYLVQYPNAIVIYDFNRDILRGTIQTGAQNTQPSDFFIKLNAHPEIQGLENEQPVGGALDSQSLTTLQSQFPQVYAQAKAGDYLLRYQSKLIVYDYTQDRIVALVNLQ